MRIRFYETQQNSNECGNIEGCFRGAKKTHIVYCANPNFELANKYLNLLKEKGLIEQKGNLLCYNRKRKKVSGNYL